MFVDNSRAHETVENLKAIQLEFSPPNNTSVRQSMDQDIIQNIKVHCCARLLCCTVPCFDNGNGYSADLYSAIKMLTDAWKAIQPSTIAYYFNHVGFYASEKPLADKARVDHQEAEDVATAVDVGECLFTDLRNIGMNIPEAPTFRAFADLDKDLELCAELMGDEIMRQVLTQPEDSDSNSDDDNNHLM